MSELEDSISLNKKHQSKFSRKFEKLKQNSKPLEEKKEDVSGKHERGIVYVGHIPHGFYEHEMRKYFWQFGKVLNVRVCRSSKTGKPKGYGFVEFADVDVAKIAADTMNNYLMFKRKLIAKFVPLKKQHRNLFRIPKWSPGNNPGKQARKARNEIKNANWDEKTHLMHAEKYLRKLKIRLNALKKMGIEHNFEPVDVPKSLQEKVKKLQNDTAAHAKKNKKTKKKKVSITSGDDEGIDTMSDENEVNSDDLGINDSINKDNLNENGIKFSMLLPKKRLEKGNKKQNLVSLKSIKKKNVKSTRIAANKLKMAAKSVMCDDGWSVSTKKTVKNGKAVKK